MNTTVPSSIFFIGARASGKTTTGRLLADALGWTFADTDLHLVRHEGRSVAEIVAAEGWEGFRRRESAALRRVTAPQRVIATGGGMVLAEENRSFMRRQGLVLYLQAPVSVLTARLQAHPQAGQRPSLTGKDIADEVADILAQREALYMSAAHHALDAARSPEIVTARILELLHTLASDEE